MDEKFRIPVESIAEVKNVVEDENSESLPITTLNLTEESLKHTYEFIKGRPNSEFMYGWTEFEPKFKLEKQVIYHEPPATAEKDESLIRGTSTPPPVEGKHRAELHKAPTNI